MSPYTGASMRAVVFRRYGDPSVLQLEECGRPVATPQELVVRVLACGVNPIDGRIRSGVEPLPVRPPFVLGFDVAGLVVADGHGFAAGAPVLARIDHRCAGGYAQFARVRREWLARVPPGLDMETAAALPTPALAAHQALFAVGRLQPGETVLVVGVAGAVGRLAVQLARRVPGVRVLGMARATRRQAVAPLLDAFVASDALLRDEADLVIDLVGAPLHERTIRAVRPGGRIVTAREAPLAAATREKRVRTDVLSVVADVVLLQELAASVRAGELRMPPIRVEPLEAARDVHWWLDAGRLPGHAVLLPDAI